MNPEFSVELIKNLMFEAMALAAPILLTTTSVTATSVSLAWNADGNPNTTQYSIERSTDGVTYIVITSQFGTTYTDATVLAGFTARRSLRMNPGRTSL